MSLLAGFSLASSWSLSTGSFLGDGLTLKQAEDLSFAAVRTKENTAFYCISLWGLLIKSFCLTTDAYEILFGGHT